MLNYYWSNRPRKDIEFVTREELQKFFASVYPYVKINRFCKELGISQSNVSQFTKYAAGTISTEKLIQLYTAITDYFEKIA